MLSSTFERGYSVLSNSVVPVKQVKRELVKRWADVGYMLQHSPPWLHSWLTWQRGNCQLPGGQHPEHFFSSSTWWRSSSCHTAAPGWAGSPGSPLEQRHDRVKWEAKRHLKEKSYQPVWNFVAQNLTSDFPDGLSGISPHYGKCDYSIVFTTLQKGGGEEASCAHVSWMNVPLDNMFTQILLWTNERSSFSSSAFRICTC